ncbi:RrF2 family transcriptional regulator [Acetohalobium arabaticum]|uniref:Transcriptional regulator, BadM/Rrf2 family n=1 Tax=Acetohalobium arabaticum (strain ATCC 49924 / DSM 5501 / Z-7288) TaxID=574087 RepID=D9QSJ6_ACEAZ|nr:Rrf2 family transcriptional regulator [Acetohalobium arabaticum]ADL13459.1 transcriptional regulator, BadM/Rrf2 family [Acetohalobium arabaticum DSM 5501]
MQLSTKGRYGVRAMFDLALQQKEGPIPLKEIAERQKISDNYLEQLIAVLKNNRLVESVRGAYGGYLLAKPPEEISIGDIIRALEGPIDLADCVGGRSCEFEDNCIVELIWQKVKKEIDDILDSITLEDLLQEAANAQQDDKQHGYMYYI